MEVELGIVVQADFLAVNEPSGATQFGVIVEVVLLEEGKEVVLIDADNPDIDGRKVDGLERQRQRLRIGQDRALDRNLDGGDGILVLERGDEVRTEGFSCNALDVAVNPEVESVALAAFEIDLHDVVADVAIGTQGTADLDQARGSGIRAEGLAELQEDVRIVSFHNLRVEHFEFALRGNDGSGRFI